MGGYYCGLCGILAASSEEHKKVCKCEALVERAKRHAEERDHYCDEVQRLNLQIEGMKKEAEENRLDRLLRCGCEFDKDHKQTAECGWHMTQRTAQDRLNGAYKEALELIRDNTGEEDGEYAVEIATRAVGPLPKDQHYEKRNHEPGWNQTSQVGEAVKELEGKCGAERIAGGRS